MIHTSQNCYSFCSNNNSDSHKIIFTKTDRGYEVTVAPICSKTFSKVERVFFCSRTEDDFLTLDLQTQEGILKTHSLLNHSYITFSKDCVKIYDPELIEEIASLTSCIIS